MGYTIFILKTVYILFLLPCLHCQAVCGTLRLLNPEQINRGDDVRLEFSSTYNRNYKSLVSWWKYLQKKANSIDTTLQRFHIDGQQDPVTLTIHNVTAEDNGEYTAGLVSIQCSPPTPISVTVKEPKIFSINPQFPDNVFIPELDCVNCLVGTVGVYNNVECIVPGISKKIMKKIHLKLKKNDHYVPNVIVDVPPPFYRAFYKYMPSVEDKDHSITCEATRDGQQPVTVSMILVILRKPSIPTITLPDPIKEGKRAKISCKTFNARPEPRLYFMYNSTTYNTSNSFSEMNSYKTVDAETILEDNFSRYDDKRSLKCCVEFKEYNKNVPRMKTNCSTSVIDVLFPPKFLLLVKLNTTNDEEGNTQLMLQCTSDVSNPASEIRWNIASNVKRSQEKEKVKELSGNTLSANLTRHNNGETVSCYIENPAFPEIKVIETYTLNITYKPIISFSPSSPVTTYVDESISILCQCEANPPAKMEWSNTSSNEIGAGTEASLELNMQFNSTGSHNFTCNAKNAMGSAENVVLILVKEKPSEPKKPIPRPTSLSTGKVISSSMLIGIICGCLAIVLTVIIAFVCVIVWKTRKKTPTRERSDNVHIHEGEPSFHPLDPDHNDPAGSNHGDAPSEAFAEPVEYTCVVKRAVRQATKPQTEEGALIYADLDLPAEGSTRRKPTVNSDAETTYVSIDFAKTKKKRRDLC